MLFFLSSKANPKKEEKIEGTSKSSDLLTFKSIMTKASRHFSTLQVPALRVLSAITLLFLKKACMKSSHHFG